MLIAYIYIHEVEEAIESLARLGFPVSVTVGRMQVDLSDMCCVYAVLCRAVPARETCRLQTVPATTPDMPPLSSTALGPNRVLQLPTQHTRIRISPTNTLVKIVLGTCEKIETDLSKISLYRRIVYTVQDNKPPYKGRTDQI